MKLVRYTDLAALRNDEIHSLTKRGDGFTIVMDRKTRDKIVIFLENEKEYLAAKKNFLSRLVYVWGGARNSFLLLPFIRIWNEALIDGLAVMSIEERDSLYYLNFACSKDV